MSNERDTRETSQRLHDERTALAYYALGCFTALRKNDRVPEHVRASAQGIEDKRNALTAQIDDLGCCRMPTVDTDDIFERAHT